MAETGGKGCQCKHTRVKTSQEETLLPDLLVQWSVCFHHQKCRAREGWKEGSGWEPEGSTSSGTEVGQHMPRAEQEDARSLGEGVSSGSFVLLWG